MAKQQGAARGKTPRKAASFSNLLKKAPKIKNFWRTTLSGVLFQSDENGKFVLQTADGVFHELNVSSVKHYRVLQEKGEFTIIEVQVSTRDLSETTMFRQAAPSKEQFSDRLSKLPAHLSDPQIAQNYLDALVKDPAHPIHQYWQFGQPIKSPFTGSDHPFASTLEADSKDFGPLTWE
jgi:hypothetical protein